MLEGIRTITTLFVGAGLTHSLFFLMSFIDSKHECLVYFMTFQ